MTRMADLRAKSIIAALLLAGSAQVGAQAAALQALETPAESACHLFIDYRFIWTLEIIIQPNKSPVPILNIITFTDGEWDLRPNQIHLVSKTGAEAEVERFSIDTGVPGDPYVVHYLKVLGNSFIGMDLLGDFRGFDQVKEASIELGDTQFILEAVDCLEFENIAYRINQVNYDSPDIRQDFEVLKIEFKGKRKARRRFY